MTHALYGFGGGIPGRIRPIGGDPAPRDLGIRVPLRLQGVTDMFVFFSNRLGCGGSIAVSVIGTVLLILLIRSCSGYSTW